MLLRVQNGYNEQLCVGKILTTVGQGASKASEVHWARERNRTHGPSFAKKGENGLYIDVIAVLIKETAKRGVDYRSLMSTVDIAPKKPQDAEIWKLGEGK